MSTHSFDSNDVHPDDNLQPMLARLRCMTETLRSETNKEYSAPTNALGIPVNPPVTFSQGFSSEQADISIPMASPVVEDEEIPIAEPADEEMSIPMAAVVEEEKGDSDDDCQVHIGKRMSGETHTAGDAQACPSCQFPRKDRQTFCENCGWVFTGKDTETIVSAKKATPFPTGQLAGRYEPSELIGEDHGIARYRALDYGAPGAPIPVILVRAAALVSSDILLPVEEIADDEAEDDSEILPTFDDPFASATMVLSELQWPSLSWEKSLLTKARHTALPRILDQFQDGEWEYLVEEAATGISLWDAWEDREKSAEERFGILRQIAEALHALYRVGTIPEGISPDQIVVNSKGQARFREVTNLLPLPLPDNVCLRGSLYAAPELIFSPEQVDGRTALFSFAALLYALHLGREFVEMDFERQGSPKPFLQIFPDIHPLIGRLVAKNLSRDMAGRFPTADMAQADPSGFHEMIQALVECGRELDHVRLDVAAWTTTGMARSNNEDAFDLVHATASSQDRGNECTLILLTDGMGGYEAGEVASALAIQTMRRFLLDQPIFSTISGKSTNSTEGAEGNDASVWSSFDLERCKQLIEAAMKKANTQVFLAGQKEQGRQRMGCTAEVVYIHGKNLVVGHVGDSRTYHFQQGSLRQITRDQTLVNRLVELGSLTPLEAETHPRRSELQQAIGGHIDVEPALYHAVVGAGDWVVVCSDGLSNQINAEDLRQMLETEATSAEMAARRLINYANIQGALDNATVVVVRVT